MEYEKLLIEADAEDLNVKEIDLESADGRIRGKRIGISKDLKTSTEKACALAEEMGHHHTSVGNILEQDSVENRKQERRARLWAYDKQISLHGLVKAAKAGCKNSYEAANYLKVTEKFLIDAVEAYKQKYGVFVKVGEHTLCFEPCLYVLKSI